MPLILEDEGKRFGGRQIIIPQVLLDHLRQQQNIYSGDEYKTSKGYKRLNALLNRSYNDPEGKKERQNNDKHTMSFADAKRIDFDMQHMKQSEDNPEYDMIGGNMMRDFVHNTLKSLRNSVSKVKQVPEVPKLSTNDVKPKAPKKDIKLGNINLTITN